MNSTTLLEFLRRELAPTPRRGEAALRLTLSCIAATIPILTHHIPHGLIAMIAVFLITKEDTSTTLLGSIMAVLGVTLGLGMGLLALKISLEVPWLRLHFFAAFLVGGLFLKRILAIEGLGSAIGLPAALEMILPDVPVVPGRFSPSPEFLVEFVLWSWLCVFVAAAVNLGAQLLLAPDPLTLLRDELQRRLLAVEETLLRLGGAAVPSAPPWTSPIDSLLTAGMSRPVELLKVAGLTSVLARHRHEQFAAIITLVDRLVTDAAALQTLAPAVNADAQESLLRLAGACARTRRAFAQRPWPCLPAEVDRAACGAHSTGGALPSLADIERTLDEIAVVARVQTGERAADARLHFLVPDAFSNPEYVQFAIKGAVSAMICYLLWVGFDYRGIYTSVITCFVVSLSTIGASNQKGLLRFGGAAGGGAMGLISLVYLFPNAESIGGFWLIFGAGTAIAAWGNFGSPRISYLGYQMGLAFWKAVLHDFGPSRNLTVLRDRLNGIALGLIVFGIVEHVLWPVRAVDRMRERLADMLRALAALARLCGGAATGQVHASRRLISKQVGDLQAFIESSKFESANNSAEIERLTGNAQSLFLVLLAIAHDETDSPPLPADIRAATNRLATGVTRNLLAMAERIQGEEGVAAIDVDEAMRDVERVISGHGMLGEFCQARLCLYRELVAGIKRLTSTYSCSPASPVVARR